MVLRVYSKDERLVEDSYVYVIIDIPEIMRRISHKNILASLEGCTKYGVSIIPVNYFIPRRYKENSISCSYEKAPEILKKLYLYGDIHYWTTTDTVEYFDITLPKRLSIKDVVRKESVTFFHIEDSEDDKSLFVFSTKRFCDKLNTNSIGLTFRECNSLTAPFPNSMCIFGNHVEIENMGSGLYIVSTLKDHREFITRKHVLLNK